MVNSFKIHQEIGMNVIATDLKSAP